MEEYENSELSSTHGHSAPNRHQIINIVHQITDTSATNSENNLKTDRTDFSRLVTDEVTFKRVEETEIWLGAKIC